MRKVDLSFLDVVLQGGTIATSAIHCQQHATNAAQLQSPLSSSPPGGGGPTLVAGVVGKGLPPYFETLYTKEGFARVKEWFRLHTSGQCCAAGEGHNNLNRESEASKNESDGGGISTHEENEREGEGDDVESCFFTERQFVEFIRSFSDCSDIDALEVFDILNRQTGRVEFTQFFLLIAVLAARESASLTQFLYLHGADVFGLLSDPRINSLTFERFSKLGFIVGVPEDFLLSKLSDHGHHAFDRLDIEGFMLFYFDVFSCIDSLRKKNKPSSTSDGYLVEGGHGGKGKGKDCLIC